ncbi:MAG TPA: hypothetical protein VJP80_00020 [Candidatus Saccharimonadales bacterium]|nr:hypothetical protein [Candidatus Saccharimonadales bacterium]
MNKLEHIVDDYIRNHQHDAERELHWFAIQPNLRKTIEMATLAKSPSGKRLSHQYRIPSRVLEESCQCLLGKVAELEAASSFEELHDVVHATICDISGIGKLTVYDTALRIGAFRGLAPRNVFLHAGTRVGARKLGLDTSQEFLPFSIFPTELRVLKPREIEDVLCIYKHRFNAAWHE